jgi:hypothetical protein
LSGYEGAAVSVTVVDYRRGLFCGGNASSSQLHAQNVPSGIGGIVIEHRF